MKLVILSTGLVVNLDYLVTLSPLNGDDACLEIRDNPNRIIHLSSKDYYLVLEFLQKVSSGAVE